MDEGLLNDLLECSVCLERLDTSSRVLPCQHTFCLKCLKVIVESHKELRCPECRILVEAKVEELPPNVLLMRILEGMKNSAPRKLISVAQRQRTGHSQIQAQQVLQQAHKDKQLPPHARAMYDFISKEPGDLSFNKGETIFLQKKLDAFWYTGECSGRVGMFPITYVQVVIPLPVPTALCKALYDFRMSAPDEEGCLAFDKGAIITVHRRVDENWAEGRLEQRVGIFPIAFVDLNQPARQLMNSTPLNRPVPPLPDQVRAGHSDHRHHAQQVHRYQQMCSSMPGAVSSSTTIGGGNIGGNGGGGMSVSQPAPGSVTVSAAPAPTPAPAPRHLVDKHHVHADLIHFNVHAKANTAVAVQSVSRISDNYDRLRSAKFDYSPPVHKLEATYQNVRTEHFPVSVANFNTNNVSSDSSSSMNTPSVGASSATTPNTSSDTSCESNEASLPSSPENNDKNPTVVSNVLEEPSVENLDASLNTSMGVLSLNESSTATNTSLNVSLPPSDSPKLNSVSQRDSEASVSENSVARLETSVARLDVPSSSKVNRPSGPDSILNFGLGLQAALSPLHSKEGYLVRTHRDHHHREKRHSLTPTTHLGNHSQNRHSAEIVATSLLDNSEGGVNVCGVSGSGGGSGNTNARGRRRRASRSSERAERGLPAPYIALYPYKPQKPDELELTKGAIYTVTERCRDGWYKGWSERGPRPGVFPGNYVAPATASHAHHHSNSTTVTAANNTAVGTAHHAHAHHNAHRNKHDKTATSTGSGKAGPGCGQQMVGSTSNVTTTTTTTTTATALPPPDAPPRAHSPHSGQPMSYPWSSPSQAQPQQSTPRSDKQSKDKSKADKCSSSSGVSLMKVLAAMKKCKSPPPAYTYSMDNPVFEDTPGTSVQGNAQSSHPLHVRSGSCPSQLLRALPASTSGGTDRIRYKERPSILAHTAHHNAHNSAHQTPHRSATTDSPWQTQHRKSQSLDVTATRRDRHHSQTVKERFRCIVPYPPNSEYELELKVDDIVLVSKKRGDGWYKGTLQRTGRTGLFPASFVQSVANE